MEGNKEHEKNLSDIEFEGESTQTPVHEKGQSLEKSGRSEQGEKYGTPYEPKVETRKGEKIQTETRRPKRKEKESSSERTEKRSPRRGRAEPQARGRIRTLERERGEDLDIREIEKEIGEVYLAIEMHANMMAGERLPATLRPQIDRVITEALEAYKAKLSRELRQALRSVDEREEEEEED